MASPDPIEVARGYVARADFKEGRGPEPILSFKPLTVWEDWIVSDPERAWPVFLEIVRLRPSDDEVLARVGSRIRLLLDRHWDAFNERAISLVGGNPRLTRIVPAEALTKAYYEPKYKSLGELAGVWVENSRHYEAHGVRHLIRQDPNRALGLVLELIRRAPLHHFSTSDVTGPLEDLLRWHGAAVIEDVESAAAETVAVRKVLWWISRRQGPPRGEYDIQEPVWSRVVKAAGDTTEYNIDTPPGDRRPLPEDLERLVETWFAYEETFWAWSKVSDIVEQDAERGWELVCELVQQADNDDQLGAIGAGPLEDLLRKHGQAVVDRVEGEARRNTHFRMALGCAWLSLDEVPSDLADRFYWASDGELQILERNKEPWRGEDS